MMAAGPPAPLCHLLDGRPAPPPPGWGPSPSWPDAVAQLRGLPVWATLCRLRQGRILDDAATRELLSAGDGWALPWLPALWAEAAPSHAPAEAAPPPAASQPAAEQPRNGAAEGTPAAAPPPSPSPAGLAYPDGDSRRRGAARQRWPHPQGSRPCPAPPHSPMAPGPGSPQPGPPSPGTTEDPAGSGPGTPSAAPWGQPLPPFLPWPPWLLSAPTPPFWPPPHPLLPMFAPGCPSPPAARGDDAAADCAHPRPQAEAETEAETEAQPQPQPYPLSQLQQPSSAQQPPAQQGPRTRLPARLDAGGHQPQSQPQPQPHPQRTSAPTQHHPEAGKAPMPPPLPPAVATRERPSKASRDGPDPAPPTHGSTPDPFACDGGPVPARVAGGPPPAATAPPPPPDTAADLDAAPAGVASRQPPPQQQQQQEQQRHPRRQPQQREPPQPQQQEQRQEQGQQERTQQRKRQRKQPQPDPRDATPPAQPPPGHAPATPPTPPPAGCEHPPKARREGPGPASPPRGPVPDPAAPEGPGAVSGADIAPGVRGGAAFDAGQAPPHSGDGGHAPPPPPFVATPPSAPPACPAAQPDGPARGRGRGRGNGRGRGRHQRQQPIAPPALPSTPPREPPTTAAATHAPGHPSPRDHPAAPAPVACPAAAPAAASPVGTAAPEPAPAEGQTPPDPAPPSAVLPPIAPQPLPPEGAYAALAASRWFCPVLAAVAEATGRPVNAAAAAGAHRAAADYAAWLAGLDEVTRAPFPDWAGLVSVAAGVVGDKPIPFDEAGYVAPDAQNDLLGLDVASGSLPSALSALSLWASERHMASLRATAGQAPATTEGPPPAQSEATGAAGEPLIVGGDAQRGQALSIGEVLAIRAGKYGPTVVDLPRHFRAQYAALVERWLTEAVGLLRAGEGTMPTLLWAPRLLLAGNPRPSVLAWRLRRARVGCWRDVLADVSAQWDQRLRSRRLAPSRRWAAARTLFSRGEVTKGLATLARDPTPGPQPTEEALRAKFPPPLAPLPAPEPFPRAGPGVASTLRSDIEQAANAADTEKRHGWAYWVNRALLRPRWSCAHGPDGMRYSHLRQLVVLPDVGLRLLALIEQLVDLVASGRYCPNLQDVSVTAVPKPQGGVRPIGVSSIWRRMPMFIAAARLESLTPPLLALGQFATAPAGPQIFARRTRRCVEGGLYVARLDIRNAYGCVDRARIMAVLDSITAEARALRQDVGALKTIRAAYGAAEDSYWARSGRDPVVISTERGITQGCPAGSLVFALVMADVLGRTTRALASAGYEAAPLPAPDQPLPRGTQVALGALHDDIVVASPDQPALIEALEALTAALDAAGMQLGLDDGKSLLLVDDGADVSDALFAALGRRRDSVAKCAGIPISTTSPSARRRADELLTSTVHDCLRPLRALEHAHPQDTVKVLAVAGARCRTLYHAACTHDSPAWPALRREADQLTRSLLAHALGPQAEVTTEHQWLMALLPAREGGLGVHSCTLEAELDRRAARVLDARDVGSEDDLATAMAALDTTRARLHRHLATLADTVSRGNALETVQRAHQKHGEVASLWTANVSHRDRTLMPPRVASKAIATYLLAPAVESLAHCGEARHFRGGAFADAAPSVGPTGAARHHQLVCPVMATRRHNAACAALRDVAHSLGHRVVMLEQGCSDHGTPFPAAHRPSGVGVPGDLVVRCSAGPYVFADLTVALPAALLKDEAALLRNGKPARMLITQAAHARKTARGSAGEDVMRKGALFAPMAFSAFGAADKATMSSLGVVARAVDSHNSVPPPLGHPSLHTRLLAAAVSAILAENASFALAFEGPQPVSAHREDAPSAFGLEGPQPIDAPRTDDSASEGTVASAPAACEAVTAALGAAHGASAAAPDPSPHSTHAPPTIPTTVPAVAASQLEAVSAMARMRGEGLSLLVPR